MKGFFAYEIIGIVPTDFQNGIDLIRIGYTPSEIGLNEIKKAIEHGFVSEGDEQMLKSKGYFVTF